MEKNPKLAKGAKQKQIRENQWQLYFFNEIWTVTANILNNKLSTEKTNRKIIYLLK